VNITNIGIVGVITGSLVRPGRCAGSPGRQPGEAWWAVAIHSRVRQNTVGRLARLSWSRRIGWVGLGGTSRGTVFALWWGLQALDRHRRGGLIPGGPLGGGASFEGHPPDLIYLMSPKTVRRGSAATGSAS